MLHQRDGGEPAELPFSAVDQAGRLWTDLANNPEGVAACGFVEVPAKPDPAAIWIDGAWIVVATPAFDPAVEIVTADVVDVAIDPATDTGTASYAKRPLTADEMAARKAALGDYARRRSYEIRIGGTLINGVPIKTDDGSLALINGMASLAGRHTDRTFNFDTNAGTVALSAADASSLADAVGGWVQGTFDRRASVLAAIAAGTLTTEAAVEAALTAT